LAGLLLPFGTTLTFVLPGIATIAVGLWAVTTRPRSTRGSDSHGADNGHGDARADDRKRGADQPVDAGLAA